MQGGGRLWQLNQWFIRPNEEGRTRNYILGELTADKLREMWNNNNSQPLKIEFKDWGTNTPYEVDPRSVFEVAEWCYGAPAATVGDYNNNNDWNIDYSNRRERDVEIDNKTAAIPTDGDTNQWAEQCYPDGWKWIFYYVDRQQQMAGLLQQLLQKQADLRPRTEQPAFYDSMNATCQAMLKVAEGLRTISDVCSAIKGLVDMFGMAASDAYNNLCAGESVECKLNIGELWTAASAVRMPSVPVSS
ncbi:hypothetical protein LTS18_012989 [Coniosporium uncinatum]|uniref:Uncharacterized protein n=1 Tax=Coniosporium uncinatum TaxID=93489 RepID=A0ACC3CWR1_9PEZI|nr:hypothetical protein LTS18_012989 [Coniosporium uncinatum]